MALPKNTNIPIKILPLKRKSPAPRIINNQPIAIETMAVPSLYDALSDR